MAFFGLYKSNSEKQLELLQQQMAKMVAEDEKRRAAEEQARELAKAQAEEAARVEAEQRKAEQEAKDEVRRGYDPEREVYRNSPTPWIKFVGNEMTDQGIKVSLDWNDAFIEQLKAAGYTGVDETQYVQKYLIMLTKMIATDLAGDATDSISENID